jgi:hypothetical protein
VAGADLRAALEASCFLGALAPVDFLAVYFVLAIFILFQITNFHLYIILDLTNF